MRILCTDGQMCAVYFAYQLSIPTYINEGQLSQLIT